MIVMLFILIGILVGTLLPINIPYEYTQYMAIAILAA